jgi:hypothetical protein
MSEANIKSFLIAKKNIDIPRYTTIMRRNPELVEG